MEICILSKMFPPDTGGAETYAYELANALGRAGHNVDVYTMEAADSGDIDVHENVSVTRLMKRRRLVAVDTVLFSIVARLSVDFTQYDIIHGTLMPASTVALTPGLGMPEVPLAVTSHGTSVGELNSSEPRTPIDYLMKYVFHPMNIVLDNIGGRFADRILAISDDVRDQLVGWYKFDQSKVAVVPHGVDPERFSPDSGPHRAPDPDRFTLLYVGRLGPRKGVDLAIESLARLDRSDVELLIAGTGRHEDYLRDLATDHDVEDQVRFLGYVSDEELPGLYASVDLFVLLSTYEGFGLVLLEAMAAGTPVVAADRGGIPTAVADQTGLLVSRDVEAVSAAVERYIDDPEYRSNCAQGARRHAENLSWDSVASAVTAEYRQLGVN